MSNKTFYPNSRTIVSRFKKHIESTDGSISVYKNNMSLNLKTYYLLSGFHCYNYFLITIIKYSGKNQKLITRIDFTTDNKEAIKDILEELIPNINITYN